MAIPAILQQLGRNQMNQAAGPIKQMMNMVKAAKDPQAALNMLAMNNPKMKQVMDIVEQYGGDSMAAFKATAAWTASSKSEIEDEMALSSKDTDRSMGVRTFLKSRSLVRMVPGVTNLRST